MTKGTAGDGETGRGLGVNVQHILSAVQRGCGHSHHALSYLSRCVVSAFDSARRIRRLKQEVETLSAHISLMNVCHADRVTALERECRHQIDSCLDEMRAAVAKVVPPDLNEEVQITISGQAAREFWGRFAGLQEDDPGVRAYGYGRPLPDMGLVVKLQRQGRR